ncbi:4-carboxy-4-hydroxy-2-oxoadipate aldolase/oxaloacetate decarboxylase [Halomonas cerina]|uniref:Putative 4-hydroxy-4-methyl-2-oxoglutarate aldolase n=1 Tax=Halomonas cerina TaxID=447424 RepID=A0A839VHR3_9GAMM|nr:4-carboxy-4-hydroxy-2-oxoadipate aldolase/oxaloacetate decarboxylase [Halomonas cerina]MBB3191936.1 4-hydroxy-4-methyl-2-oxoglutarate aldolase [Halomonas cerina]
MAISDDMLHRTSALPTATLHEAFGKRGNLPSAIKPVSPDFKVCGRAVTVHGPGGDNVWLHRAIYEARPGDVLVVSTNSTFEHGYWGEIMSTAALARGLAGVVIDGGARDGKLLAEFGFPVFSRGLCIKGTGKDLEAVAWINQPVMIGEVVVAAGDLIVGDGDGVVAIPAARVADVLAAAERREADEAAIIERLRGGETTLAVYGWE